MNEIDTYNIKKMTKEKMAYDYYKKEEREMKKKFKVWSCVLIATGFLVGGTISADALTDGAISNAAKDAVASILKIKIDGEDYNAHCEKGDDGMMHCAVDSSVLKDNASFEMDVDEDYMNSVEVTLQDNEADILIK